MKEARKGTVHYNSKGGKKIIPKSLLEDLVKEADERADAPKKDLLTNHNIRQRLEQKARERHLLTGDPLGISKSAKGQSMLL